MQTLEQIIKFFSTAPNEVSEGDLEICDQLSKVKDVKEWNSTIMQIESIRLRSTIEQNGIIHQIVKE